MTLQIVPAQDRTVKMLFGRKIYQDPTILTLANTILTGEIRLKDARLQHDNTYSNHQNKELDHPIIGYENVIATPFAMGGDDV